MTTPIDPDHIKTLVAEWRHVIGPELSVRTPEAVGSNMADQLEALLAAYVAGQDALQEISNLIGDAAQSDCENGVKWLNERAAKSYLADAPDTKAALIKVQNTIDAALATKEIQ